MSNQAFTIEGDSGNLLLKNLTIALSIISTAGVGLWLWLQQNRALLPQPDSNTGRALLNQYQGIAHDIWLVVLLLSVVILINRIFVSKRQEESKCCDSPQRPVDRLLRFIRRNPITTSLFIAYTIGMIWGTTYLYKDMVGWYKDLTQGYFLDNFSIRGSFIRETMRRTDYRFFPLAHQDLHALSWFSIHIKTWMLFNAAELIGIVILSIRFLNNLTLKTIAKQSTILLLSALLLIHPSTGTAFFHVIYCERLLCLIFILYINSYLQHLNTKSLSSFYSTILWALLGIYIKDIAILLFIIPPASLWAWAMINRDQKQNKPAFQQFKLERWLCTLSLVFITSYIFLALIPSSFASEGAYNDDANHIISLDLHFYLLTLIATIRAALIKSNNIKFSLLDAINISAFTYALTLAVTYEFDASSYLALPVQLIATINITWAWTQLFEKNKRAKYSKNTKLLGALFTSAVIIGAEHATAQNTFYNEISAQKNEQAYIQKTYEKLDEISRSIRESGTNVNIIISRNSRLSADRHLNRIPYRSLIEYIPSKNQFIVKDGANKDMPYTPQIGDIVANLDKETDLIEPILDNLKTETLYRHNPTKYTGLILRITN